MTCIEKGAGGPEEGPIPKDEGEITSERRNAGFFLKLNGQTGYNHV